MATETIEAIAQFKEAQKEAWAHFAPLETFTIPPAARLVKHARVQSGQRVLDVGCGTGPVAVTAARKGARVTGLDLTPELLERARENSRIAEVDIEWRQGDAEELPFPDNTFDVVLSQFGHMFAPRPEVAVAEMLRVLKPGGTVAFSTWPPELWIGRILAIVRKYAPKPAMEVPPPPLWGDPNVVRERLGAGVKDIVFDRASMLTTALSPQHYREFHERTAGPVLKLVAHLSAKDPARLATFRGEIEALLAEYLEDNVVRQDYLLTRATKV